MYLLKSVSALISMIRIDQAELDDQLLDPPAILTDSVLTKLVAVGSGADPS